MEDSVFTEAEQVALTKFKLKLSDLDLKNNYLLEDKQLIRWLRARDLDLVQAEAMLRNHLSWRGEVDIENCMQQSVPESMKSEFPVEIFGHDRQGNILIHIPYGKLDLKKGMRIWGKERSYSMRNYYMEQVFQAALKISSHGKVMKRVSAILDFKGLTYGQFTSMEVLELLLNSLKEFEGNYPELLGTAFIVNNPAVWSIFWGLTKPFMHPKTQAKLVITGSNPAQVKQILQEYLTDDNIPEKYGGNASLKYPEPVILNDDDDAASTSSSSAKVSNPSFFGRWIGSSPVNNN